MPKPPATLAIGKIPMATIGNPLGAYPTSSIGDRPHLTPGIGPQCLVSTWCSS